MPRRRTLSRDPKVIRFVAAARNYCRIIERRAKLRPLRLIAESNRALIELHTAVMDLPDVRPGDARKDSMSTKEWMRLFRSIGRKLGKRNGYWRLFDGVKGEAPLYHSLSDDLADVYRDLRDGLELYDRGGKDEIQAAVWEWRFRFTYHWGRHLVDSMGAMHRILSDEAEDLLFRGRKG